MKKKRDLYICYGSLAEDDKRNDLLFWKQTTAQELFRATTELCRVAEQIHARREGRPEVTCIDKREISYGALKN